MKLKCVYALPFTCVAIALIAVSASAQAPKVTAGLHNGRAWIDSDEGTRVAFLMGYSDHHIVFADAPIRDNGIRSKYPSADSQESDWWPAHLTFGEISKAVTKFYDEPENVRLPIRYALCITALRVRGTAPSEIERLTAFYRALFANEN